MNDQTPDNQDFDRTRSAQAGRTRRTDPIPPPPRGGSNPTPPGRPPSRRGSARQRRDSGLYLPLWTIILTLFAVFGATAGIVLLVLSLGNDNRGVVNAQGTRIPPTMPEPVLIVSSPIPTTIPAEFPLSPATPTIPPEFDPSIVQGLFQVPPDFSLSGPVLPTPFLTPTPIALGVGATVIVVDVGDQDLNVRDNPGIFGTEVIFRAAQGQRFQIVDGPSQQDNLTWWQIRDVNSPNRVGWASGQYLRAVPADDG